MIHAYDTIPFPPRRWMSAYMGAQGVALANSRLFAGGFGRIALLDRQTGAADPNFDPAPDGQVTVLYVDGQDVYAAGAFTAIGAS